MSASCAGTPHTSRHTASAVGVLTHSRLPHWPTAPRLVTSAPIVTYSRYAPTGDSSYSSVTTPPSVQPSAATAETPSGSASSGGARTSAGRNQKRPEKLHG